MTAGLPGIGMGMGMGMGPPCMCMGMGKGPSGPMPIGTGTLIMCTCEKTFMGQGTLSKVIKKGMKVRKIAANRSKFAAMRKEYRKHSSPWLVSGEVQWPWPNRSIHDTGETI